jgi:hypothetical protein
MMKTLLFATAAVTALCVAAPASARMHHYYGAFGAYGAYRGIPDYAYAYGNGYHGYVPNNYATYCGQLPKAC